MGTINNIKEELALVSNPEKADILKKFFKAFPGGYGGEDDFLGIKTPDQRVIAKRYYNDFELTDLSVLLETKVHEYRMCSLMMLVLKYKKTKALIDKKIISDYYLEHRVWINNWDLVDSSAHYILGDFLLDKDPKLLYQLAESNNLWEQRIAVIASFAFIRKSRFTITLDLAKILLHHEHDLIHKAVGWMLREIGNRDIEAELDFLNKHCLDMPRTMLRYAIEKFPEDLRLSYLRMKSRK